MHVHEERFPVFFSRLSSHLQILYAPISSQNLENGFRFQAMFLLLSLFLACFSSFSSSSSFSFPSGQFAFGGPQDEGNKKLLAIIKRSGYPSPTEVRHALLFNRSFMQYWNTSKFQLCGIGGGRGVVVLS